MRYLIIVISAFLAITALTAQAADDNPVFFETWEEYIASLSGSHRTSSVNMPPTAGGKTDGPAVPETRIEAAPPSARKQAEVRLGNN